MTKLLEQAVTEAAALPDDVQDALASQLLRKVRDAQWHATLSTSESLAVLDEWAAEALWDLEAGRAESVDDGAP